MLPFHAKKVATEAKKPLVMNLNERNAAVDTYLNKLFYPMELLPF